MFYVYILKLIDGKYYVGMTSNLIHRLFAHLSNNGSVVTKKYKPVDLYYVEETETRKMAIKIETSYTKEFKKRVCDLELDKKYENTFKNISEFIKIHGDDCWYNLRNKTLKFKEK